MALATGGPNAGLSVALPTVAFGGLGYGMTCIENK
jgi:hypothetical protein